MDLRQLTFFLAVYRRRSFGRAAAEFGVTHSAVTRALQKLEDDLGVQLFARTTRSVEVTEAGERIARRAAALMAGVDALAHEARSLREGTTGAVRIGAMGLAIEGLVTAALADLAGEPGLSLSVETGARDRLIAGLHDRSFDFICLAELVAPAQDWGAAIVATPLPSEPAVIAARAGHPVLRDDAASWTYLDHRWASAQLSAEDLAAFPPDYRDEMARRGVPQIRLESQSACLQLLIDTDVLVGLPLSVGRRLIRHAPVALIGYPFPMRVHYSILRLRGRTLLPAAQQFHARLEATARRVARDTIGGTVVGPLA